MYSTCIKVDQCLPTRSCQTLYSPNWRAKVWLATSILEVYILQGQCGHQRDCKAELASAFVIRNWPHSKWTPKHLTPDTTTTNRSSDHDQPRPSSEMYTIYALIGKTFKSFETTVFQWPKLQTSYRSNWAPVPIYFKDKLENLHTEQISPWVQSATQPLLKHTFLLSFQMLCIC